MFTFQKDLYLPAVDVWIDPHRPRARAFVSHGHGDHIARHDHIITTPATARIIEHRLGKREFTLLDYGEWHDLGAGVEICLHPAGHILGSAQLEVRSAGSNMVYSGDFRLKPSETAEACTVVPCETLVMECTYGRPHYVFPPREEVLPVLVQALRDSLTAGETPVVLAYTLGRSQELLKLLEPYELDIVLAPPIYAMVRVYESLGIKFGKYDLARPERTDGKVLFVPPHGQKSRIVKRATNPVRYAVTGWALDGQKGPPYPTDKSFAISDHADFDELKQYVREAKPRQVYTMHGFDDFRGFLKEQGVHAHPVEARVAMQ